MHEMPSGVAMEENSYKAFKKAWHADSLSNFGSVDVFSGTVNEEIAFYILENELFIEVLYAPNYTPGALKLFNEHKQTKGLRLVKMNDFDKPVKDYGFELKRVTGGLLVQERFDTKIVNPECVDCVSERKPTAEEIEAAIFNWIVACYTRSNAIVIGDKDKTHRIGSGQGSRIDAAHMAIYKANGRDGTWEDFYGSKGTVMASDAFMPFTDVVELAAKEGITAIMYPLGSISDQMVIDKANEYNIAMLITRKPGQPDSERCFLHR